MRGFVHITAAIGLCAAIGMPAGAETLRISAAGNKSFAFARAIDEVFVPEVTKVTGGRHTAQSFWGSQLGGQSESVAQVRNGTIFGVVAATSYFASFVPELNAFNLPFLFDTREKALGVFDGPIGKEITAKLDEKGFVALGYMELGFRQLTNSVRPIASPADLSGLKIRVQPNPVYMETFRKLGANPIQMDIKDLFSALRQGVVDGQENPFVFIDLLKLHEANQKYVSDTGHVYEIMLFAASKKMMEAMTPADREAIMKAAAATTARQRVISAEMDTSGKERLLQHGYQLTTLTPAQREQFRKATSAIYEQTEKEVGGDLVQRLVKAAK